MKLKKVLLRWYKSFHLNYQGISERGEATAYRPWNKLNPPYAPTSEFPFIEIPIENDISTIVGANESGKSHLLNAITKVVRGTGTDERDQFSRTDLCHYASVRTRNIEAWPNIGLLFALETEEEFKSINGVLNGAIAPATQGFPPSLAIILAPDEDENKTARLFVEPNDQSIPIDDKQLADIRKLLPSVQFIDSRAILASDIPLARLLAAYGDAASAHVGLHDREAVEEATKQIQALHTPAAQTPVTSEYVSQINSIKKNLNQLAGNPPGPNSLEMQLFKDILRIKLDALQYLYKLKTSNRGHVEGQIAKWNDEINEQLNLAHFWRQDEQFSLTVNYKDKVIYFQIQDKTESIYTFEERSSGLKFFLSYYIQAKAMEMSNRNRNSIILMDEPDSALSIVGQRNLLAVFESLVSPESSNQTCQLIYTTHSPYLINRNFPRRIRVLKKEDAEQGTQYIEQARARRYEPVRTALGIDSAPSLFLGADNILLEGPTDQFLLTELIRVFATPTNVGDFLDLNAVVVVSADGVGNIENVLEQSRWADEPIPPTAVLVDADEPAIKVIDKITNKDGQGKLLIDRSFAATVGERVAPFGANTAIVTTEDIVPKSIYVKAVELYFQRWMPETVKLHGKGIQTTLADTAFGREGLVASTKALYRDVKPEFKGDFDKMGVLQEVIAISAAAHRQNEDHAEIKQLRKNVVSLCDFIRDALARNRAVTAKYSTTQAVKRIINDFNRLYKDNVAITAMQKLFRRLKNEVAPIGTDGENLLQLITGYLTELDTLRAAGQERIVKEHWVKWSSRIEQMKNNPLAAAQTQT